MRWRWLVDSLEGGDDYRYAQYGTDAMGYPARNLVRHKREYDANEYAYGYGSQSAGGGMVPATNSDYDLRLVRTPVPTMVPEVVDDHLSRIYAKEVRREGPPGLQGPPRVAVSQTQRRLRHRREPNRFFGLIKSKGDDPARVEYPASGAAGWWEDVDGAGTTIDSWMRTEVAPLLYTLGTLDILVDHPPVPEGATLRSLADQQALGVDAAVATVILPQNVVWWRLNPNRTYAECVVREMADDPADPAKQVERFRHWTAEDWTLYAADGVVIEQGAHPFGRVPIERLTLDRKALCEAVGRTPIEAVAERQREYYNRDSELILSDTQQAHPLLQGPEDYINGDGTIPIGPSWLLPKKKDILKGGYEGFDIVQFPKDGADSIRTNKSDIRDDVDRAAGLSKPAGAAGTGANTVAQSGVSKAYDQSTLVNLLGRLAAHLQTAEIRIARLALTVLTDGASDPAEEVTVLYPRQFDVHGASELATMAADIQATIAESGRAPELEKQLVMGMVQIALPGLDDAMLATIEGEITAAIGQAQADREVQRQANEAMLADPAAMGGTPDAQVPA